MEHEIVLKPEVVGHLGSLPVTNTLLVSWIVMAVLIVVAILSTRKMKAIPSGLQNFMEMIIEAGYNTVEDLAHHKAKVIFPIVMTFFLFIITANWLGLLPGVGGTIFLKEYETIGKAGHDESFTPIPLLRSINSDLNMTLALGLLSVIITHLLSIKYLGLTGYLKRWFSLQLFPVFLFVGILEIISEITKVVSLSFRLFGNIFAGEVVLATISSIFAFVVPLPFYFLEIIVGFVQAAVFMMLSLVFMVLLTEKHGEEH